MQPIQRTTCRDQQPSSAAYLAAMIDRRTREHDLSAGGRRRFRGLGDPDATTARQHFLIWVEGDAELLPEPAAGQHRGMIVVAHGSGQGTAEGSFIISYPVDADDDAPHVAAVSGVLERMGWAVLGTRRGSTAGRYVNTAALVSNSDPGSGQSRQSLWLAETVGATEEPCKSTPAPVSGTSAAPAASAARTRGIRDQLEAWVNEGGAGDDVAS